jgi:hypothetical protein
MNTTFNTILVLIATAIMTVVIALPARASAPGLTVRIVDRSAVEASVGSCPSGYTLRDESDSGSRPVAFHDGEATLSTRIGSSMVAPAFYCAGSRIGFPHAGVELEMR